MTIRALAMPWALSGERTYCLPGSLIVTLALGEAPETIPSLYDVRRGHARPATALDGGAIDRIVRHFAGDATLVARVHSAAASWRHPGQRHRGFDAAEQICGLARTFLICVAPGTPIGALSQALAQLPSVSATSPNYVAVTPFDAAAPLLDDAGSDAAWAPRAMIRAPEALAYEPGDAATLIGLIDSGVALDHPEVAGRLRTGFDTVHLESDAVAPGIKLLGEHHRYDTNPTDRFVGHGMGCAGIIGGLGLRMPPGLAGEAQIIPLRALAAAQLPNRPNPVGLGAIADLDTAVKLAVDLGAKVINMSFGTEDSALSPSSPKPHADVVRYALDRGCILVAASGNNGAETRYWPAAHEGVIAVGAVDADRRAASFSTRGDHVALCAPGERVLSAGLAGYQFVTGTSFASPFVAAAAALLVSRAARRAVPIDGVLVHALLVESAQPFAAGPASGCGAGILDAAAALAALDAMIDRSRAADPPQTEDG
ncbi:S8 family peptidase [Paraburkholderia xenovorans]|uniref:S8 family peptidase n=1 Tax=Paraburkholderia xenovorans TaxID=36873 RepID=UPI0038B8C3AB